MLEENAVMVHVTFWHDRKNDILYENNTEIPAEILSKYFLPVGQ